ncbi:MAG: serine/threonine protein kinase [Akkermansiaceae bacterium]
MNRYKIKRSLGNGRLGQVYLAEDTVIGRNVILRQFTIPKNEDRSVFDKKFLSLVKDLSSVEDASVLPVIDAGIENDTAYIVGASANGNTLQSMLGKGMFSVQDVYDLAEQLLEALGQLRQYGFFHYHFRLSSVLVQKKANGGKHFLLMDMGYSKLMPLIHGPGSEKKMIASAFAAPELCAGKPMGEITSIFMIGQLCYAMLADGHPLAKLPLATAKAKHRVGELPYISGFRGDIPESFKVWMYRLMSPNWEDRPQSVEEALAQMPSLSQFQEELCRDVIQPQPFPVVLES